MGVSDMVQTQLAQIAGVRTYRAEGFADEAGLMCAAGYRASNPDWFAGYGDLLLMTLERRATRPFHYHKEGTDTVAVLAGAIRFVLYDMREDSPTRGEVREYDLAAGDDAVTFLRVPPLVAHAFLGLGEHSVAVDLASSAAQSGPDFFYNAPGSVPYALE
jgi:dTDP-4-dehydrorhamnose 3,5-epimerase